jgi:hypothetical protein
LIFVPPRRDSIGEEDFVRRVEDETKEEKLFFALSLTFVPPKAGLGL